MNLLVWCLLSWHKQRSRAERQGRDPELCQLQPLRVSICPEFKRNSFFLGGMSFRAPGWERPDWPRPGLLLPGQASEMRPLRPARMFACAVGWKSSQASALQFNAQHNVDFNTWIRDGIPYMSREDVRFRRK